MNFYRNPQYQISLQTHTDIFSLCIQMDGHSSSNTCSAWMQTYLQIVQIRQAYEPDSIITEEQKDSEGRQAVKQGTEMYTCTVKSIKWWCKGILIKALNLMTHEDKKTSTFSILPQSWSVSTHTLCHVLILCNAVYVPVSTSDPYFGKHYIHYIRQLDIFLTFYIK